MSRVGIHLSVVIPVGPGEEAWKALVQDLESARGISTEVLLSGPKPPEISGHVEWVESKGGRAKQMNQAARMAKGEWLWFLHADSRVGAQTILKAQVVERLKKNRLYYFDLRFLKDGPRGIRINEWGANFRSRALGMPFGDQGFLISKEAFWRVGGFPEGLAYGEDHAFVWRGRARGVHPARLASEVYTSARKYQSEGWVKTWLLHVSRTYRQAATEIWRLRRGAHQ